MSREINTWRDPYDMGFTPTRPKKIEIQPGLTVLVGCNGAGKTTLLHNIAQELKKNGVPHHFYSNLNDGGTNSVSKAVFYDDLSLAAYLMTASEGEAIKENFASLITNMHSFLQTGRFGRNPLDELFDDDKDVADHNERWLLLDAIDSGMSVDNIVEIVGVFNMILEDAKSMGKEVYIIISANEYELCRNNPCFDVHAGKYRTFADYEDYRKFILKSREKKMQGTRKKKQNDQNTVSIRGKNPADSCIFMRISSQVDEDFRGGIKVKKKFSVIAFGCAIAVAILAGCKTEPESGITTEYTPAPEQLEVAKNIVKEYVDPETGVHYLTILYDPGTGELKFGGITPRLDSNGQVMIDQVTK